MEIKKILVAAAVLVFSTCGFAKSIALQVVQVDSIQKEIRASSVSVEEVILDNLFLNGFIATNSPIFSADKINKIQDADKTGINEAKEGFCEYFISVVLNYKKGKDNRVELNKLSMIKNAQWKIINVTDGTVVASGENSVGKVTSENDNKEGVQSFALKVAKDIEQFLK